MGFTKGLDEFKPLAKFSGQQVGTVTAHGQIAAPLRAVFGEGRHDRKAASGQGLAQGGEIGPSVVRGGQEMEYRTGVPKAVGTLGPPVGDVTRQPVNASPPFPRRTLTALKAAVEMSRTVTSVRPCSRR